MWEKLKAHRAATENTKIATLFEAPQRAEDFSARFDTLLFDYSKTQIDTAGLDLLLQLADAQQVAKRRDAMFAGAIINETEHRAVLHTALRNIDGAAVTVAGTDVMPGITETLARMQRFSEEVRAGRFTGQGGQITDVVNIGIGGSDLGPAMAVRALSPYHDGPQCHFVSNVDPAHIADVLRPLNPETTLVIVASKTFTTIETMSNAATARAWMSETVTDPAAQFVALSSNIALAAEFGIPAERVFGFEDWVGGRYSVWGPIGLSLMLAIGPDGFLAFLRGGQSMDRHFCAAAPKDNLPILLALVGIWHHQICGFPTRAVLPYEQRLEHLPAYFQQLEMESNGKRVTMAGDAVEQVTGPVVWGAPGTNGQHAFYQLIHQGTVPVPCEFMVGAQGHDAGLEHQHRLLVANCLAQSEALMTGRSMEEALEIVRTLGIPEEDHTRQAAHRVFPGNRPSTTLVYPTLTPEILGQIIALYEHRVFVEGVILGINSFDQWGVELGKELAKALEPMVTGEAPADDKDGSTQLLLQQLHAHGV